MPGALMSLGLQAEEPYPPTPQCTPQSSAQDCLAPIPLEALGSPGRETRRCPGRAGRSVPTRCLSAGREILENCRGSEK